MAARNMKLKLYTDVNGMWRIRIKAGNGKVLARTPRGYDKREKLVENMNFVLSKQFDVEPYLDAAGEYRWRFKNAEGEIILISSEGYTDKGHCQRMSDQVLDAERA